MPSDRGPWYVSLSSLEDLAALEAKWVDLQSRAECSFFQSWGWVGSWIGALPAEHRPRVLEVRQGGRLVGVSLLGARTLCRHGVFRSKALFVAETGVPAYDSLTIEHNGFLVERGQQEAVVREALVGLAALPLAWDELFVSGVDREHASNYLKSALAARLRAVIDGEKPCYMVDCESVRASGADYLETLGRNTRYQVRRALRVYDEQGPVHLEVASTLEQALTCFEQMRTLHQAYWEAKGERGAFGSKFAVDFHHSVIQSRFHHGEIQLAELRVGGIAIGYLYNFVFNRVVYNYQSAFRYDDTRLKPGLVSHCLAVQYNLERGMRAYDLLMGSQRYKQSLATHRHEMLWLTLQKPRLRFQVEQGLRQLHGRLVGMYPFGARRRAGESRDAE